MLKQTIQFEDHDGVNKTKNVYFNLTFDDVMKNSDIEEEFESIQREFFADDTVRELTLPEKARIVQLVKRLMQMSYGVQRQEDGDLVFDKSPKVWEHFTQTAAYDAFFFSLFQDDTGEILRKFMVGVFPTHIRQQLAEARGEVPLFDAPVPVAPDVKVDEQPTTVGNPLWIQEKRYPTEDELRKMTREEMFTAMKAKNEGWYDQADAAE